MKLIPDSNLSRWMLGPRHAPSGYASPSTCHSRWRTRGNYPWTMPARLVKPHWEQTLSTISWRTRSSLSGLLGRLTYPRPVPNHKIHYLKPYNFAPNHTIFWSNHTILLQPIQLSFQSFKTWIRKVHYLTPIEWGFCCYNANNKFFNDFIKKILIK